MFIGGEWVDSESTKELLKLLTLELINLGLWYLKQVLKDIDIAVKAAHKRRLKENGQNYYQEKEENF